MANDINIGSLLFDVGADPVVVKNFTNELRRVGDLGRQSFERAGKSADPLTQRIQRLNQRVRTLTAEYKAGLVTADQYRQRMDQLRQGFERTNRQADLNQKQIEQLARGYRTAKSAVDPLKTSIVEFRSRLNRLKAEFEQGTISEREFVNASRQLRAEIRGQIEATDKASREYGQLVNVLGTTTRSINSAEGKMSKLGVAAQVGIALNHQMAGSLAAIGPAGNIAALGLTSTAGAMGGLSVASIATTAAIAGVGLAAFALARRGIPEVKEMQQAMNILRASGEEDIAALREEIDALREAGGDASKAFSRAQLAGSLAETVKAGVDAKDALVLLATGTKLASAENEELSGSTALVLANLRQFRLDATDAARVGDALAQAGLLAAGTARDLSEGLSTVGPVARAAGLTLEQTLGILVDLDNNGLEAADRGATALRSTLAALADPTAEARSVLADLGVTLEDAEGKARPILDVLMDLRNALKGNEEAAQLAAKVFDTRAITAVLAISDATDEYTREIEDSTGALDAYAETLTDESFQNAQDRLNSSLDNLSETLVEFFVPAMDDGTGSLSDFIDQLDRFIQWANANEQRFFEFSRRLFGLTDPEPGPGIVQPPEGMVFGAPEGGGLAVPGETPSTTGSDTPAPPAGVQAVDWNAAIAKARELSQAVESAANPQAWVEARDALAAWAAESDTNKDALAALQEFERRAAEEARVREQAAREAERAAREAEQALLQAQRENKEFNDSLFHFRPRTTSGFTQGMTTPERRRFARQQRQRLFNESVTPFARRDDPENLADLVFNAQMGARAIPAGRRDGGGIDVLLDRLERENARAERVAANRIRASEAVIDAQLQLQASLDPNAIFNAEMGARAFRPRTGDGGLSDLTFNQNLFQHRRRTGGGIERVLTPEQRAFGDSIFQHRRRTGGGLEEAADINRARESLEGVQRQIAQLAGTAPSQFDQMRAAVEEFGQASGMTEAEIAAMKGQIDELEQQDKLIGTLNEISGALGQLGNAAAGTPLGDFLSGASELVDIGTKLASGDIIGAVTQFFTGLLEGFAAASKAAKQLEEDIEGINNSFDLIDPENLIKTSREQVGKIFWFIPVYGEVFDEIASEFGLSVAEAIEGGIIGGLRNGFQAYLESGNRKDIEEALKNGLRTAIIDAVFEALIEGAIVEGILGQHLTDLTEAIVNGDTAGANAAIDRINAAIPGLAEQVANFADRFNIPDPAGGDTGPGTSAGSLGPDTTSVISIPNVPNPVLASPDWVPEFGGYVADFGGHVDRFGRQISRIGGSDTLAKAFLRSN